MTIYKMIPQLLLAAAAVFVFSLANAPKASAITWSCGDHLTCHDPPCTAGETSLPDGDGPNGEYSYAHCVAALKGAGGSTLAHKQGPIRLGCKSGETAVTRNGATTCTTVLGTASRTAGTLEKAPVKQPIGTASGHANPATPHAVVEGPNGEGCTEHGLPNKGSCGRPATR